jgi:hypothetical protein
MCGIEKLLLFWWSDPEPTIFLHEEVSWHDWIDGIDNVKVSLHQEVCLLLRRQDGDDFREASGSSPEVL